MIGNGNVYDAEKHIVEILKFSKLFGAEFAGKPAHFFHGMVLVSQGRIKDGLQILEESCQSWTENGRRLRYAACGSILASVYAELSQKARDRDRRQTKFAQLADNKATAYFQDSIESAGQIGANATLGRAYRDWGGLYQEKGDTDKAAEFFAQATSYYRLCGSEVLAEHFVDGKVRETKPDIVEYANKAGIINSHLNL
jgi:tetratricopeptide (TPR) repeat protein